MMSKLPSSQIARANVIGSTAIKIGVSQLKSKAKRPFLSEQSIKINSDEQKDAMADALFKAISQLRGTAVKLAQMLSMETGLLPEKVRNELSKSYHQVPPLNRVLVQKVILQEFDRPSEQVFEKFDATAIAAASLGQVHRAEVDGGQIVAVKVQYPGIHTSIESDLKLLRKLSINGIKLLPKEKQFNKKIIEISIDEIGSRLKEETDYQLEAVTTAWFHEHLLVDGLQIPVVFKNYCTDRVITTQLLEGQHLDDWLARNPSQQLRDKAAQLIYDAFFFSTMELGCLHADPNPGNYLFKENGEVALIDFGCVKKLRPEFVRCLPPLLYAFYLSDYQKIVDAYTDIGMVIANNSKGDFERVLRPFGEWLSKPFSEASFDFKLHSDYTSSGQDMIKGMSEVPCLETVEEDFIFFNRTIYGMFKIFERLEATVLMRGHWEQYWTDDVMVTVDG